MSILRKLSPSRALILVLLVTSAAIEAVVWLTWSSGLWGPKTLTPELQILMTAGPIVAVLLTTVVVEVVLIAFLLVQRSEARRRFMQLLGRDSGEEGRDQSDPKRPARTTPRQPRTHTPLRRKTWRWVVWYVGALYVAGLITFALMRTDSRLDAFTGRDTTQLAFLFWPIVVVLLWGLWSGLSLLVYLVRQRLPKFVGWVTQKAQGVVKWRQPSQVQDELLDGAIAIVWESAQAGGSASATLLQRRLRIGSTRAAQLLDEMQRLGVIGPPRQEGIGETHEVLVTSPGEMRRPVVRKTSPRRLRLDWTRARRAGNSVLDVLATIAILIWGSRRWVAIPVLGLVAWLLWRWDWRVSVAVLVVGVIYLLYRLTVPRKHPLAWPLQTGRVKLPVARRIWFRHLSVLWTRAWLDIQRDQLIWNSRLLFWGSIQAGTLSDVSEPDVLDSPTSFELLGVGTLGIKWFGEPNPVWLVCRGARWPVSPGDRRVREQYRGEEAVQQALLWARKQARELQRR